MAEVACRVPHLAEDLLCFVVALGCNQPVAEIVFQLNVVRAHFQCAVEADNGFTGLAGGIVCGAEVGMSLR